MYSFTERNFFDLSGIWKHVVFHVGMKIRVSSGVFCPSPSPLNTYSYVGKENSYSTRKFIRNHLNWCMKYLITSTTIRKILVPNKLVSSIHKYVNTYSYVEKENSDSTRKFVRNYLNWCMKYLNTSTTIRKILVQKKIVM